MSLTFCKFLLPAFFSLALIAQPASVLIPASSQEAPGDRGLRAHTNHAILVRPQFTGASPSGETPSSIRQVYALSSSLTSGGSGIVAIVDAYHYPTAANDLTVFSNQFGLPVLPACSTGRTPCFAQMPANPSNTRLRTNCGWGQEAALDIEWAHAMAPNATIVLVEADTNSFADLFAAVDAASKYIVTKSGKGQVSMSWGGSEFSSEANNDGHMIASGGLVVYFASSGDTGGKVIYPGASVNVVAAGGTTINRDKNGSFVSETGWSGSGGGPSQYEPRPGYQAGVAGIVGTQRGVPDFSFDADPNSGVSVYDSTSCQGMSGWMVFGGTSVSSPSLAGIVNSAGGFAANSQAELGTIYGGLGSSNFRDIVQGTAGSFSAKTGWDFVTGVGSDLGLKGK